MIAATGLRGFAAIRTRYGQPSALRHERPLCPRCQKTRLNAWQLSVGVCGKCEDAEITATVNREIELAMAEAEAVSRIANRSDAPAMPLPRDRRGYVDWSRLVSLFLQGTEPVVALVDSQSCNAMRAGAGKAIRRLDLGDACYASVYEGRCYLLRVGGTGMQP